MRATLFLLVTSAFVGSLLAQYPAQGCTRHVTLPSSSYSIPTYQPQCQCSCYPPPPPRMNIVPYNYCQPTYLQQNIVPPPCPVYQSAPIIVPIPAPPKDCECAHTTVQKQSSEPRHPRGHPCPTHTPHSGHPSIPGISDADSKHLVPNLGNIGHNHPFVVQSVVVGKKGKEKEKETEEEKGEKDKDKGECSQKKRRAKKKCSEEVEDDDDEERSYRRKRKRRGRKHRRQYSYDPYDPYYHESDLLDRCAECNRNSGSPPVIMYYNR